MIINAGLKRVISAAPNGKYQVFQVQEWVKEWQERDIIDDKHQYGQDLNEEYDKPINE